MSDAIRKRDADGLPKENPAETQAIMATNEDQIPGGIRETFKFVDVVERQKLIKIYALLATDGCNIDPNGTEFRNAAIWNWYLHKSGDLCLELRFSRNPTAFLDVSNRPIKLRAEADGFGRIARLELNLHGHSRDLLVLQDAIGRLEHLEKLCIENCSLSFPIQLLSKLPKLKILSLQMSANVKTKTIPDVFNLTNPMIIHENLRRITLTYCDMDEGQLERILFDVLPKFPMVSSLDVSNNRIKSFRSIEERLNKMDSDGLVFKPALRELWLNHNPILRKIGSFVRSSCSLPQTEGNPAEIGAVCRFLRAVPTLQDMDGCERFYLHFYLHFRITLELIFNWAGRRFFDSGVDSCPLPLSLWPTILDWKKRAKVRAVHRPYAPREWVDEDDDLVDEYFTDDLTTALHRQYLNTAMFYVLRNGPVLFVARNR